MEEEEDRPTYDQIFDEPDDSLRPARSPNRKEDLEEEFSWMMLDDKLRSFWWDLVKSVTAAVLITAASEICLNTVGYTMIESRGRR